MTDNVILESIKNFLEENVSPKIQLQAPLNDDIKDYRLMNPNVFTGWLPPPNYLQDVPEQFLDGIKSALPAVIVGFDDGDDDGSDAGLNIRLVVSVYNPGMYMPDGDILFNNQGYKDLVNLMFLCRQELIGSTIIDGGKTEAQKPFKWGMYPDSPIPYWFGWITFRATAAILQPIKPIIDMKNI